MAQKIWYFLWSTWWLYEPFSKRVGLIGVRIMELWFFEDDFFYPWFQWTSPWSFHFWIMVSKYQMNRRLKKDVFKNNHPKTPRIEQVMSLWSWLLHTVQLKWPITSWEIWHFSFHNWYFHFETKLYKVSRWFHIKNIGLNWINHDQVVALASSARNPRWHEMLWLHWASSIQIWLFHST